jgi:hypothetical protein
MTDEEISALEAQARAIGGEGSDVKITGHKLKKAKGKPVADVVEEASDAEASAETTSKGKSSKGKSSKGGGKKK